MTSRIAMAVLAVVAVGSKLHAQNAATYNVSFAMKYYECTSPATPRCICFSEKDKAKTCDKCTAWVLRTTERPATINVATWGGAYEEDKLPFANYFLKGVAEGTYKVKYPNTPSGAPVTTGDLFDHYAEYGWSELAVNQSKKGSVAVWDGGAGVVVSDSAGAIRILYSSASRDGQITEGMLNTVIDGKRVKFIMPREYVAAMTRPNDE